MLTAIRDKLPPNGEYSGAALEYAIYVDLLLEDLRRTANPQYEALRTMCIRHCAVPNSHKLLGPVLDDNVWDMSPLLFELCLLGGGAKAVRALMA